MALLALGCLALPLAAALDNGVGRTPMMGWMAWIRFRCNIACDTDPDNCISEKLVKTMADAMVAGGESRQRKLHSWIGREIVGQIQAFVR
jgi:hypothetical protein